MSAIVTASGAAPLPSGMVVQPAGPVLRDIGQAMGVQTPSAGKVSAPPPWLPEDADAFERSIEDICEQIEA